MRLLKNSRLPVYIQELKRGSKKILSLPIDKLHKMHQNF